jgi:hypothetical protein
MQFSPSSSYLLSRRTKYSSQRPVVRHFQFICMHVSEKKNLLQLWTSFQETEMKTNWCRCQHCDRCMSTEPMLSYFNDLREKNLLCDSVLRLEDGGVYRVHRPILSAGSTYFRFVWLLMWLINV